MQELELTWGQLVRIWWAVFWRWLILNNFTAGMLGAIVGIPLLIIGHREWVRPDSWILATLIAYIPSAVIALRLAFKARYKGFRIATVAAEAEPQS